MIIILYCPGSLSRGHPFSFWVIILCTFRRCARTQEASSKSIASYNVVVSFGVTEKMWIVTLVYSRLINFIVDGKTLVGLLRTLWPIPGSLVLILTILPACFWRCPIATIV